MLSNNVEDWTFPQLVQWAAWAVIQAILKGTPMESAMHPVVVTIIHWRDSEAKKQVKGKENV